ncbi:hypothetical protein ACFX1W_023331 [Malus domestica]
MVTGYEHNGDLEQALEFFSRIVMLGLINPDRVTLVSAVSAHSNAFLNLYAKTSSVKTAARLFTKMPEKDVASWSSMIACYAHDGDVTNEY